MILSIISVSHRPLPDGTFWTSSFSYTRMPFFAGDGEGIYANNFIPTSLFFLFSQAHSTCAHKPVEKKIIKIPHSFISHTETHTHAYQL